MRFKIITRDEAFDHLQRGDGEVCIVKTITDDTPIGALRNAEGFLLGIREEQAQETKAEATATEEAPEPAPDATVGQMFAIIGICIVLFGCLIILVSWILGKVI